MYILVESHLQVKVYNASSFNRIRCADPDVEYTFIMVSV